MFFYIPTTSLNFNDIFATECISPKIFHSKRFFGTSRYFFVKNNNFEDGIFLYKSIPSIEIDENLELMQLPVFFKIFLEKNDELDLKLIEENIYLSSKTIYLEPKKTEVYFRSEEDMKKILNSTLTNLETKTIKKYIHKFKVINDDCRFYTYNNKNLDYNELKSDDIYIKNELSNDSFFDTVKGLYYGLIINKPEIIYNDFDNEICKVEYLLEKILVKNEKYRNKINSIKKSIQINRTYEKNLGREGTLIQINNAKPCIQVNRKVFSLILDKYEYTKFEMIINQIIKANMKVKNRDSSEYYKVLIGLLNREFYKAYKDDPILEDLVVITNLIENQEQNYNFELFNTILMKNFYAALILKKDFDSLRHIVINNNIKNNVLSFGFAGAILGFSSFPKTITREIYDNDILSNDIDYQINMVRKKIWKHNNSNYTIIRKIYMFIGLLKKNTSYYKMIRNLPEIEKCLNCKIKLNNINDRVNIIILTQNKGKYIISLYLKEYKNILKKFTNTLKILGLPNNLTSGNFKYFYIWVEENNSRRNLNKNEELFLLDLLKNIFLLFKKTR